jgi:bifunctional NMN adenylyltransferase/nudix hydrolase
MNVPPRKLMLEAMYPSDIVRSTTDIDDDPAWSKRVDATISEFESEFDDITIYGSRDSFLSHYLGKHKTDYYVTPIVASATERRIYLKKTVLPTPDFRHGIIYAVVNRFPVAFHTVDIAIICNDLVMLCRKPDMNRWHFIGGFVDPSDNSAEEAALRELGEEVADKARVDEMGNITQVPLITSNPVYVGSSKIDDPRYRDTRDSVLTSFFKVNLLGGEPSPTMDANGFTELAEVKWVPIKDLMENISRIHTPLAAMLVKQYSK